jgi:Ca-activated chloride channel homolog
MRRRSILKWIVLTAISLTAVFKLPTFVNNGTAAAPMQQAQMSNQGSLQALDNNGNPAGECPLKHTEVKAEVSGFLARVTVIQDFENNRQNKIEAVYTFPLPEGAAVDDLTMQIGDRTIKGKIMRRQEAKATYAAAKQAGQIATILNQQRANVFRQGVANILPGQRIRVSLSYVETLKYEDGSYEWSFPMVVDERYTATTAQKQDSGAAPDVITPPRVPFGRRLGHDISIEVKLDTGVPIVGVNSETHETEVQQIDNKHAVVRLKDQATIPNKDFVLTYRVAGDSINDAVLAHRSERGGFFTLILQPPQRVAAEDVMPKELVFVLDTSGSMSGFPIEKAKETMNLALNTLYPHDTFNLITFAGETKILFPGPVPATPGNLQRAKAFLATLQGDGSTEMMQAIRAALDASDSPDHIRIATFMTDGQVGNEAEIIAEVQKHPNARVFAMGFGPSPNRSLLDRMSQNGRGEVNYISENGDTSLVAKRFNDRVRSPLLTDISIDWGNLPVTDVFPKHIPDLFSVKPLIVSGRYEKGAKGTIRLRGKMAGQDFVREIPVELPEKENDHDVLANVWARRRIDELMSEELATAGDAAAVEQKREEITQLGLEYKLMTQYTSFVAVDDTIFTGTDKPERVEVPIETQASTIGNTAALSAVMVTSGTSNQCSVQINCIQMRSIQELPIQGRSVIGLLTLAPTVSRGPVGGYIVDGVRRTSDQFTNFVVDGVSGNVGIAPGGQNPGPSAAGNVPALTASGGAQSLATLGATQELTVQTSSVQAQYAGTGAQVEIVTRSGTNSFHGSMFHFFGNDALDANDWFANSRSLDQPPGRLNLFGGTLGGPIRKDRTFFFGSYEGMHLRQPMVGITDVPSAASRAAAPAAIRPFLDAFPLPNGDARADGFAEFGSSFANPARHDAGSLNIDHSLNANSMVHGRYSFADSDASQRGSSGFSLNTLNRIQSRAQTFTGSYTHTLTPSQVLEVRANYSRLRANGSYLLDDFGRATAIANILPPSAFTFDLSSRNAAWMVGDERSNVQRQLNLTAMLDVVNGNHDFKFGGNYRRLSPVINLRTAEENALFNGLIQAMDGVAARVNDLSFSVPQSPVFNNLSLYAQDEWRQAKRLTLTYGVRWELAPPPTADDQALAVDQVSDPATLKPAAPGTSLWKTTFLNFAPRAGVAYELSDANRFGAVLRGGVGVVYDVGRSRSGDLFAGSIPFVAGSFAFNSPFPVALSSNTSNGLPFMAFDPRLKLPYIINWNVELQQSLGVRQSIAAAYIGSSGQRLIHTETLLDQNPDFSFLRLTTNRGSSDYRGLQLKFERTMHQGLAALVTYTWAQSLDNVADDSPRRVVMASLNPDDDRGPSDFDVRHSLAGYITYELPALVSRGVGNKMLRNWALDSIFNVHSARPLNVVFLVPTSIGVAYSRPDAVSDTSFYVLDPEVAGGRRLNATAFLIPLDLQQGNLPRNSLRGFQFYQVDLALRRRFNFREDVGLQIQADAFNLFNRANFEDPLGNDLVVGPNLAFGQSTSMSGRSLSGGGFPSFYTLGGARTIRLSVRFLF